MKAIAIGGSLDGKFIESSLPTFRHIVTPEHMRWGWDVNGVLSYTLRQPTEEYELREIICGDERAKCFVLLGNGMSNVEALSKLHRLRVTKQKEG